VDFVVSALAGLGRRSGPSPQGETNVEDLSV
jgi:hypothetical protein